MRTKEPLSKEVIEILKAGMGQLGFRTFVGSGTTFFNDSTYEVRVRWDGGWTLFRSEHGGEGYRQNGRGLKNLVMFLQLVGYSIKPLAVLHNGAAKGASV